MSTTWRMSTLCSWVPWDTISSRYSLVSISLALFISSSVGKQPIASFYKRTTQVNHNVNVNPMLRPYTPMKWDVKYLQSMLWNMIYLCFQACGYLYFLVALIMPLVVGPTHFHYFDIVLFPASKLLLCTMRVFCNCSSLLWQYLHV